MSSYPTQNTLTNNVIDSNDKFKQNAMKCLEDFAFFCKMSIFGGYLRDSINNSVPSDIDIVYHDASEIDLMLNHTEYFFDIEEHPEDAILENYPADEKDNTKYQLYSYTLTSKMNPDVTVKIDFVDEIALSKLLDVNENGLILKNPKTLLQRSDLSMMELMNNIMNKNFTLTVNSKYILKKGTHSEKNYIHYRVSKLLQHGWVPKEGKATDISKHFAINGGSNPECGICKEGISDLFHFDSFCCQKKYHFKCMKKNNKNAKCIQCNRYIFANNN